MSIRKETLPVFVLLFALLVGFISGCANRTSPEGGPYDETPPRLLASKPLDGSVRVKPKKIVLKFDEIVQVKDQMNKVVVSPPQTDFPEILAAGKSVIVRLQDSLKDHTTYVVNFTDAICDYNENTPIENFYYTFSTGDYVDSMKMSGYVIDAWTLEPVKDLRIGVHANLADSSIYKLPFFRVGAISEKGQFSIINIPDSTYRVYAIQDLDRNYMLSPTGEGLAFLKDTYHTMVYPREDNDSIESFRARVAASESEVTSAKGDSSLLKTDSIILSKNDSLLGKSLSGPNKDANNQLKKVSTIDETATDGNEPHTLSNDRSNLSGADVLSRSDSIGLNRDSLSKYVYLPDNLLLRYYVPEKKIQKLLTFERSDSSTIRLSFDKMLDSLPKISIVDYHKPKESYTLLDMKCGDDSTALPCVRNIPPRPYPDVVCVENNLKELTYHLLSPNLIEADSIVMHVSYATLDSLNHNYIKADTLTLRKPKPVAQQQKKEDKKSLKKKSKKQLKKEAQQAEEERRKRTFFESKIASLDGFLSKTPSDTVCISFKEPLKETVDQYLTVYEIAPDTTIPKVRLTDYKIEMKQNDELTYYISAPWKFEHTYTFRVDSAKLHSYTGKVNLPIDYSLKVGSEKDFGKIKLNIAGADSTYVVLLLDGQDKPVDVMRASGNGEVVFPYVKPGKWYAKLYIDTNHNGRWDVGDYPNNEPEMVYYYPKELLSKANWTVSEQWNPTADPLQEQKPKDIRKVKFKEDEKKKSLNEEYWERMAKKWEKRNFDDKLPKDRANKEKKSHSKNQQQLPAIPTTKGANQIINQ